jgi:hypothetical protein
MSLALTNTSLRKHTDKPVRSPCPPLHDDAGDGWGITSQAAAGQRRSPTTSSDPARELIARRRRRLRQFDEPVLSDVLFGPDIKERTFMCASMAASSGDPHKEMTWAARMMNAVVEGIDGIETGVHVCRASPATRAACSAAATNR